MCLEVRSTDFKTSTDRLLTVIFAFHAQDKVQCKKDFEHCIGGCSGDLSSSLHYDFSTMVAIAELNPDVLGEDGFHAAAADCNVKQGVIEVPLFEGGDR